METVQSRWSILIDKFKLKLSIPINNEIASYYIDLIMNKTHFFAHKYEY
jgi:hypothetical protein